MIILAIDTATLTAGVAVYGGEEIDSARVLSVRRARVTVHSEKLLGMIDEALREAGVEASALDGVACGAGPGSFTGLRIALSTAKGLCFAAGCPLALVSSLAALAARAPDGTVCATLDAYKAEVYAGVYRVSGGVPAPLGDETALAPAALTDRLRGLESPLFIVGDGALRYPEIVVPGATLLEGDGSPGPQEIARLGYERLAGGSADDLSTSGPRYIRASEAELVKQRRSS